jgi:hypothetical protein
MENASRPERSGGAMKKNFLRKIARRVMAAARRISPANSREWATAMAAEMDEVEGSFESLLWALGCFGVALKCVCASWFRGDAKQAVDILDGSLANGGDIVIKKWMKVASICVALLSLLFLLAPSFKQGIRVALVGWHSGFALDPHRAPSPELLSLAKKAEAQHDAETLAFVAMRLPVGREQARLADEAVAWNSQLTWIYSPLVARQTTRTEAARWLARLQSYDPGNAANYALEASRARELQDRFWDPEKDSAALEKNSAWLAAMDKAYSATSYDSYFSRRLLLDRDVMIRRHLVDPIGELHFGFFPSSMGVFTDLDVYQANVLSKSVAAAAKAGDLRGAENEYWKAIHLSEQMQLHSATDLERIIAFRIGSNASAPLESLLRKTGDLNAASLLAFQRALATHTQDTIRQLFMSSRSVVQSYEWNGFVVQGSFLLLMFSCLLIVCCGIYFALRYAFGRMQSARLKSIFQVSGILGSFLLFLSSVVLYTSYLPYSVAYQYFLVGPDPAAAPDSLLMFASLWFLPQFVVGTFQDPEMHIYFWYAVIGIGAAAIIWLLARWISRGFHNGQHAPASPAN